MFIRQKNFFYKSALKKRAEDVHHCIKTIKIPGGADNVADNASDPAKLKQTSEYIEFMRMVSNSLSLAIRPIACKLLNVQNKHLYSLTQIILNSILAMSYGVGRCGEQANSVFNEFVKLGFGKSMDLINITGKSLRIKNSQILRLVDGGHDLVVLDRDKKSQLNDLATWNDTLSVDTWYQGKVQSYDDKTSPELKDLTQGIIIQDTMHKPVVKSEVRLEKNLTAEEFALVVQLLKAIKDNFTMGFFTKLIDSSGQKKVSIQKEYERIHSVLDAEILDYQRLAKKPPQNFESEVPDFLIRHYKPSAALEIKTSERLASPQVASTVSQPRGP